MDVLIVMVFVSLVLVAGALVLLLRGVRNGDFEHGDRLSLLPLESDDPGVVTASHRLDESVTTNPGPTDRA